MFVLKPVYPFPLFFVLFTFSAYIGLGQASPENGTLDVRFGKPTTFYSKDSSFYLGIGGRIQAMTEVRHDFNTEKSLVDFYIRRLRLSFAGSAISKKFTYRIQLSFSQRDISPDNSQAQNNLFLRDAMLFYSPNSHWRFGFGQTKLPGNRQRQISSGNLQLPDRSNTNALFTLDRDKGFWIYYKSDQKKNVVVNSTFAISTGEGRINSDKTANLCYSLRGELLPFGAFTNGGDYLESDHYFEDKLKLSLGLAYSYNNKTSRVAGQLGEYLYNNQLADLTYYGTDVIMKFRGWSFLGELYRRKSNNGVSILTSNPAKVNFVYSGTGLLLQSGFLFTKKDEIIARYGRTSPDKKIDQYTDLVNEYVLGYSHYFFHHKLKILTDASIFKGPTQKLFQWRFSSVIAF